jgi:hypothetical protein
MRSCVGLMERFTSALISLIFAKAFFCKIFKMAISMESKLIVSQIQGEGIISA